MLGVNELFFYSLQDGSSLLLLSCLSGALVLDIPLAL